MKCLFVSTVELCPPIIDLELDVLPQVNDAVCWPGVRDFQPVVRHIKWYLTEDDEGLSIEEPFVCILVGPKLPT